MGPILILSLFSIFYLTNKHSEYKEILPFLLFYAFCFIFFVFIISRKFVGLSFPIILPISILAVLGIEKIKQIGPKAMYAFFMSLFCLNGLLLQFSPKETSFIMGYLISSESFLILIASISLICIPFVKILEIRGLNANYERI